MSIENEIACLFSTVDSFSYSKDRFTVFGGEDKYIFGMTALPGEENPLAKLLQYKTLYDTLRDLDWKVKYSFSEAIQNAYSYEVTNSFDMIVPADEKERLALEADYTKK